jgi:hypothetical protein
MGRALTRHMAIKPEDIDRLSAAAAALPPPEASYIEDDFVMNLFETVLDFQMPTTAVVNALERYRAQHWDHIRTIDDLGEILSQYPDDQAGNTALAQHLWGYNLWTRAGLLRRLVDHFRGVGVTDQKQLRNWASEAHFKRDFEGRVKGLGLAVFQWLVMRQGVETVKPDVHVRRFVIGVLRSDVSDAEAPLSNLRIRRRGWG